MSVEFINPEGVPKGSYSHAAVVDGGRLVFLSGQVAQDAQGNIVGDTFERQAEQVFANLSGILQACGASWQHIVKMNVYVCDLDADRVRTFREVRSRLLGSHKPASTLVGTTALVHEDLMLEVEAVVLLP